MDGGSPRTRAPGLSWHGGRDGKQGPRVVPLRSSVQRGPRQGGAEGEQVQECCGGKDSLVGLSPPLQPLPPPQRSSTPGTRPRCSGAPGPTTATPDSCSESPFLLLAPGSPLRSGTGSFPTGPSAGFRGPGGEAASAFSCCPPPPPSPTSHVQRRRARSSNSGAGPHFSGMVYSMSCLLWSRGT